MRKFKQRSNPKSKLKLCSTFTKYIPSDIYCKLLINGLQLTMIKSFRHKGLQAFFETGSKAGIQPHHASKLRLQLSMLDSAKSKDDVNVPAWRLHELKDSLAGHYAIWVNGNWRLSFKFTDENIELVDYQDYH